MRLSQCMIVKNEENNIRRALSWGKGIVSEQIVVDTGSTDRTVDIAMEMGATVYRFEWTGDFAAAKNYAIEKASGDWIAFLDADEYFNEQDASRVLKLIESVERGKKNGIGTEAVGISCDLANLNAEGKVTGIIRQVRLFKNRPYIRYVGRIHEYLENKNTGKFAFADFGSEITIYHTGYAWTEESLDTKGRRNLELLLDELKADPDNARIKLHLAQTYNMMRDYKSMLSFAKEATENADGSIDSDTMPLAWQYYIYALYKLNGTTPVSEATMLDAYEKAVLCSSSYPDYDTLLGFWYHDTGQTAECKKHLLMAIEKADTAGILEDSSFPAYFISICNVLVEVSLKLDEWQDVVKYATLSLQTNKKDEALLSLLLTRFCYIDREPISEIISYLQRIYNFSDRRDLYYLLKVVGKANFKEIETALKGFLTPEERAKIYGLTE